MQISNNPAIVLPSAYTQRVDVTERVQKEVVKDSSRNTEFDREKVSLEPIPQQIDLQILRVDSVSLPEPANSNVLNNTRNKVAASISLTTQRALTLFTDNIPSVEQQLGIELAGIDTFA